MTKGSKFTNILISKHQYSYHILIVFGRGYHEHYFEVGF